jgi:hypothetical protein
MSFYYEIAEALVDLSEELRGSNDDHEPAAVNRKIEGAAGYMLRAAELLLELDVGPELAEEVRALAALCECGHDQGDHMVEAPHVCEGDALEVDPGQLDCGCTGFRPAPRDTLADFMTEPAPAPPMGEAS